MKSSIMISVLLLLNIILLYAKLRKRNAAIKADQYMQDVASIVASYSELSLEDRQTALDNLTRPSACIEECLGTYLIVHCSQDVKWHEGSKRPLKGQLLIHYDGIIFRNTMFNRLLSTSYIDFEWDDLKEIQHSCNSYIIKTRQGNVLHFTFKHRRPWVAIYLITKINMGTNGPTALTAC